MAEMDAGDNSEGLLDGAVSPAISSDEIKFKDPLLTGLDSDDEDQPAIPDLNAVSKADTTLPQGPLNPNVTQLTSFDEAAANFDLNEDEDGEMRDLFVTVDKPEKHVTTLEAYVTFCVTTKTSRSQFDSCDYSVRRRYNDFLWLRQQLENIYPTHLVPPLPEKHSLKRLDRFSQDFVRMRKKALHKFLTRLADHPVLSFDKHLQVFLTTKAGEFQLHKKQGKGMISQVASSIQNMGASYMMKYRAPEFTHIQGYINIFGEKMGSLERIANRVLREQADYLGELCEWPSSYALWANSEDQISGALSAMSTAIEECCTYLKDVVDDTDDNLVQPLREYILYSECIKSVLRKRDAIQLEYDSVVDELNKRKDEREQVKISDQTYSIGAFLGKDPEDVKQQKQDKVEQRIADMAGQKELLNDKTEMADANLKADMERWRKTKRRDMREMFTSMADRQITYYEKSLLAWEDAIRAIQRKDESEEVPVSEADSFTNTNATSTAATETDTTTTTTSTSTAITSDDVSAMDRTASFAESSEPFDAL